MVVIGQSGVNRIKWFIRAKVVVFGQKWFYFGHKVIFGQKLLCSRKMVVFGQHWL